MSVLGSIRHLMSGSGLRDALELVYTHADVSYVLKRNSHSCAVRVHLLMDAALNAVLTTGVFDTPWVLIHRNEVITNEHMYMHYEGPEL